MLPRPAYRRFLPLGCIIAAATVLVAAYALADDPPKNGSSAPATQPGSDDAAAWNEVGVTEDTLHDAWAQRVYQFKIGSPNWRITIETENPSGSSNAHVRLALEVETIRDFRRG